MKWASRMAILAVLVVVSIAVALTTGVVTPGAPAANNAVPSANCHLGNGITHVIEITFDNVHFFRDNPNVLSDLEQMPALNDFIQHNGTMLSNNHTPLIAHTADDSITNYSGLYGDRHGQGIGNSYETYNASGTPLSRSSFAYWTGTYGLDAFPNQPYSANVPALGSPPATPPAPWVPFTRAGCDVGDVSTANMVLENTTPDIKNVFGDPSPELNQLNADTTPFKNPETNDYLGLAVHCAQSDVFCTSAQAVKFGQSTPSATASPDVLPDEPGGYLGYQAVFGHRYLAPQLKAAANSGGNRMVNGHTYPVYNAAGNLVDLNGNQINGGFTPGVPGFPGFGPITATQSLAYVADMQEVGIPVTYGYISDAHEKKSGQSGCSNTGTAQGPGDSCYKANLAAYNAAFTTFFQRLADDGITPSNTLFVITADEGDHFAGANVGRALDPTSSCTGTPGTLGYTCVYPSGMIGERQVSIHGLMQNQLGNTTPFYNESQGNSIYINGNPGPNDPVTRQFERDLAKAKANNPYDGDAAQTIAQYEADPGVEQLLHFVNADPNRTPTFTMFPKPDYFFTIGATDGGPSSQCAPGTTPENAAVNCSSLNNGFAWDHGYYAPEIDTTWVGMAGPGVAHKGVDGLDSSQGPSSADGANASPQLVTTTDAQNPGTWADHTDIRPTLLALVGLKDDYVSDGRVLTEDLTITPGKTGDKKFQALAACYKQLNSSVGQFGTDILVADTAALKTGSASDDSTYQSVSSKIQSLGSERDALATTIKQDLFDAEFNNTKIPLGNSNDAHCNNLLRWTHDFSASVTR
jgi:hypothetical protein